MGTATKLSAKTGRLLSDLRYSVDIRTWFRPWPKFDMSELPQAAQFLQEHGWVILRRVFTDNEVRAFREGVRKSESESNAGELLANPYLGGQAFILDDRIATIARGLLRGTPVYFGDSTWNSGGTGMGFHKDNPDKERQDAPDWRTPYTIIRIGLYLQDHKKHSGGLALRDGSHRTVDTSVGQPFAAPTELGDVAVWSLRTSHSGFVSRLRAIPNAFLPLTILKQMTFRHGEYRPSPFVFRPLESDARMALFATFGLRDHHLRRYVEYLKTRQYAVHGWQVSRYGEASWAIARANGVELVEMYDEVRDVDVKTLNLQHEPFPY